MTDKGNDILNYMSSQQHEEIRIVVNMYKNIASPYLAAQKLDHNLELVFSFLLFCCKTGHRLRQMTEDDLFGYFVWIGKKGCTATELSARAACITDFFHVLLQEGFIQNNPLFKVYNILLSGDRHLDRVKSESLLHKFKSANLQWPQDKLANRPVLSPSRSVSYSFGWMATNKNLVIFACVLLVLVFSYINFMDSPGWQSLSDVPVTASNDLETKSKNSDRNRDTDKKIDFFRKHNMKDYYCRDYLKTTCNSTRLPVNPVAVNVDNIYEGGRYYMEYCARCHGDSGRGNGPDAVRHPFPIKILGWAGDGILERDAYLFWTIARGGADFGGSMPPFKDILSESAIWKVIHFLKTLR